MGFRTRPEAIHAGRPPRTVRHDAVDDREPESHSPAVASPGLVEPDKALEDGVAECVLARVRVVAAPDRVDYRQPLAPLGRAGNRPRLGTRTVGGNRRARGWLRHLPTPVSSGAGPKLKALSATGAVASPTRRPIADLLTAAGFTITELDVFYEDEGGPAVSRARH